MNQHLGLFIKRHESAIRALVHKNKPVETSLDPAVLAGTAGRSNDQIAFWQTTDPGNRLALVKHCLDTTKAQSETPRTTHGIGKGQAQRHLGWFLCGNLKHPQAPFATIEFDLRHSVPGQFQPGEKLGSPGNAKHDSTGRRDDRQVGCRIIPFGREIAPFLGLMPGA